MVRRFVPGQWIIVPPSFQKEGIYADDALLFSTTFFPIYAHSISCLGRDRLRISSNPHHWSFFHLTKIDFFVVFPSSFLVTSQAPSKSPLFPSNGWLFDELLSGCHPTPTLSMQGRSKAGSFFPRSNSQSGCKMLPLLLLSSTLYAVRLYAAMPILPITLAVRLRKLLGWLEYDWWVQNTR